MPVVGLDALKELGNFISGLCVSTDISAIHALRYHKRVDCSRQTMRTFMTHTLKSSPFSNRGSSVRKRPAAVVSLSTIADLVPHLDCLRRCIQQGFDDAAIVQSLRDSAGRTCAESLIAQFRLREQAAIDIQQSWRDYASRMFAPSSYPSQPQHASEFRASLPLIDWIKLCSWSYCPECCRRRTVSGLSDLVVPALTQPSAICNHKRNYYARCSRPASHHQYVPQDQRGQVAVEKFHTQEAYVCPRREDWPVYDSQLGRYVSSEGPSSRYVA